MEKEQWFDKLRDLAEQITTDNKSEDNHYTEASDFTSLVHEIKVYQAELEIQNEELRKAQAELIGSRDRFSALFHNAPVGYVVLSESGIVLEANQTASKMLGRDWGKLLDEPFFSYIDSKDHGLFLGRFRSLYKNPKGKVVEVRMNRRDGSSFHARMEGTLIPIFHDAGHNRPEAQLCLVITDETETKEAERALKRSESEYRNLVNSLNDAIVLAERNGKIILFNPGAEKLFHCTAEEAVGASVARFCPGELRTQQAEMLRQAMENKPVPPYQTERITADGQAVPVEIALSARTDDTGNVIGIIAVLRDITALKANERYLRTILQTTVDGFWEIDSSGHIVEVNPAYCALSGYERREILGMRIGDLEAVETPAETAVRFQRILSNGHDIFETWHRRKDGSVFPLEISVTLIDSKGGRMVCFCRNLTERKAIEREREKLISELKDALAQVKTLNGLLPICSYCKKIRDDTGYWNQIESYIQDRSEAEFSHGICEECAKKYYPDINIYDE